MHSVANVSDGSRMSLIVGSNEKQVQTQAKEQRSKLVAGAAMAVRRPPDRRKDENFGGINVSRLRFCSFLHFPDTRRV